MKNIVNHPFRDTLLEQLKGATGEEILLFS